MHELVDGAIEELDGFYGVASTRFLPRTPTSRRERRWCRSISIGGRGLEMSSYHIILSSCESYPNEQYCIL